MFNEIVIIGSAFGTSVSPRLEQSTFAANTNCWPPSWTYAIRWRFIGIISLQVDPVNRTSIYSLRIPFAPVRMCNFQRLVFADIPNSIEWRAPAVATASNPSNWTRRMSDSSDTTLNRDRRNSRCPDRSIPKLLCITSPHCHWKSKSDSTLIRPKQKWWNHCKESSLTVYPA